MDVWYIDKQKAYEGLKAQGETKDWKIESPDDINGFLEDYLIDEIKDAFMDGLRGDYYGEIESVREQMYNNAMKGIGW